MGTSGLNHRGAWLAVALMYLALALLAFRALVSGPGAVVPAGPATDYDHFIWNYWWLEHALREGVSFWTSDYMLFPFEHDLSLHTLTPVWFPLWLLAEPLVGRIGFLTLAIILSAVFTGLATYAWLRPWSPGWAGAALAFAAGVMLAFQPYALLSASKAHLNVIALWWLPLTALLWREVAHPARLRRPVAALLLGLALWGCWLTDLQLLVYLPFTLGGYALWTLWQSRHGGAWRSLVGWGLGALLVMVAGTLIWPLVPLLQVDTGDPNAFPPAGLSTLRAYSLEPAAWLGLDFDPTGRRTSVVLMLAFWLAVGMRGGRLLRRRGGRVAQADAPRHPRPPLWLWLLLALPPALLMLGPDVFIGEARLPLPFVILDDLFSGQFRTPERFVLPLVFVLATACVLTLAPPLNRLARRGQRAALAAAALPLIAAAAAFLDAGWLRPFPVTPVQDYPIHAEIGTEDADYVILDVPVGTHYGWTGMGPGRYSLIYAPVHQKRMVNGFLARMPYGNYAYFAESPLFTWLAFADPRPDAAMATVAAQFDQIAREWPVGYVFAYRQWMTNAQQTAWIGWLNDTDRPLCPPGISDDGLVLWWRARSLGCGDQPPTAVIDLGGTSSWQHTGTGWYAPEDIGGTRARWAWGSAALRLIPDPQAAAYTLTLEATAFQQATAVVIDGQRLTITPDGWNSYSLTVPAAALADGALTLTHLEARSPADLGLSPDTRLLAAAYRTIRIEPAGAP
ncbi:MAG: hypothetical protein ACOCXZ_00345 [Chloroflexota bacterium]